MSIFLDFAQFNMDPIILLELKECVWCRKLYCLSYVIITLLADPYAFVFVVHIPIAENFYFMSEIIVLSLVQFDEIRDPPG